jgi:carbonic anhydrase
MRPANNAFFCLSLLSLLLIPIRAFPQSSWSYQGENGPASWGKLDSSYSTCSLGHTQSPIDITGAKKSDLPALKFDYNGAPLNIIDNGHTIQVNYPSGSTLTVGEKVYTLKQFHFHHPSEEHVNGHAYDMVVHLVHADALDQFSHHQSVLQNYRSMFLVSETFTVFLNKGNANPLLDSLWAHLPTQKEKAVDVSGIVVNAKDLLPADHGYYTFAGSLTTPPCSEGVTWYVMKSPLTLSDAELAAFARLYPLNARPIQPTNGREILETK